MDFDVIHGHGLLLLGFAAMAIAVSRSIYAIQKSVERMEDVLQALADQPREIPARRRELELP